MRFPFTRLLPFAIIVYYSNTPHEHIDCKTILCFLLIIPIMANARSNDIQTWIEQIGRQYAPDSRTAVYTVSSELLNDSIHILEGKCDNRQAVETLLRTLDTAGISYINAIKLLPDRRLGEKTRGIVTVCCAHLRSEPRHSAEMVSQAILGTPLLILEEQKGWYRVQTPDNYISWIIANSISVKLLPSGPNGKMPPDMSIPDCKAMYMPPQIKCRNRVRHRIGLYSASRRKGGKKFIPVSFPDGRTGFLKHDECRELSEWASAPVNMNKIIQTAKGMMGTTYLWGGTSVKSADCSGFVKTAYFSAGIILSRDASQQALTGDIMPAEQWDECQTGDLLFFGNAPGKVSHVALYLNDGKYIHSSGQVKINSIDARDTDYYAIPLLGISRIVNKIGTPGITAVKRHPWYFEQK